MKKLILSAAIVMMSVVSASASDPVEGVWQTEPDDGAYALVTMAPCGPNICGVIARTFNADGEYKSENIGKKIIIDMGNKGGGRYEGQVWRPSNNKIYMGKMDVDGKKMKLRGCVAGGLLCSSQNWIKVQ